MTNLNKRYVIEYRLVDCKDGKVVRRGEWKPFRKYKRLDSLIDAWIRLKDRKHGQVYKNGESYYWQFRPINLADIRTRKIEKQ